MLAILPSELLLMIFDLLESKHDVDSISRVSRRFYLIITPLRYRTVTFSSESEWALDVLNTRRFIQSRSPIQVASHLGLVRQLRFVAPFRAALLSRCYLPAWWSHMGELDSERFRTDAVWDILDQLGDILGNLKRGSLTLFWWHLGTCLPPHVLDEDGYIPTCQGNIQDLSLRTDPNCPHGGRVTGLRQLRKLQSLRWQQIVTTEDLSLIVECLEHNCRTLNVVDLEVASELDFGHLLVAVSKLSRLHALSLGNFRFTEFIDAASILSVSKLRSLTLRNCPYQLLLLRILSGLQKPIPLRHFEIALDERHDSDSATTNNALFAFLESFDSLEHLHILVSNPTRMERSYLTNARRSETTLHVPVYLLSGLGLALSGDALQNIGLCLSPVTARAVLQKTRAPVKALHLRLSGRDYQLCNMRQALLRRLDDPHNPYCPDDSLADSSPDLSWENTALFEEADVMAVSHLIRLADWAFGPEGVATLRILAYGDFSCGGRHKRQQAILARADPDSIGSPPQRRPYTVVSQHDVFLETYKEVRDMVSACPLEALANNRDGM
ncbi:hypothetical protein ZTR_09249 [Talaromyces verruculosus]|nr:hypothetical protein ZTR_09249 [Talaromyces verruculosus]